MNFEFDETEQMLADAVTRYMQDHAGLEQARADAALAKGFSEDGWATCAEMGWLAAPFSEEAGGFGMGAVGSMIVEEAMGAGLSSLPYLTGAVMAGALLEQAGENGTDYLDAMISGSAIYAVALHEAGQGYDFFSPKTVARASGEGWVLSGEKSNVISGASADGYLVTAKVDGEEELGLFFVVAGSEGVAVREINLMDNRRAAHVSFQEATAVRLDSGCNGAAMFEVALDNVLVAAASENLGAMQAAFDLTLDYAKTRKQFGQPLGKFQVLQHRLVDMSIKVEEARSLVMAAAMALKEGQDDARAMVAAAWVQSIWSGRKVGEESIQIHGGIGMTDELAVGDYVKRINVNELLFGIPMHHVERYNQITG